MTASYHPPALFPPQNLTDREALLGWVETAPLVYGPWQNFKAGFKTLEGALVNGTRETQLLGALLSRIDAQDFPEHRKAATGTRQPLVPGYFFSLMAGEGVIYAGTANGFQIFDASSPLVPISLPLPQDVPMPGNGIIMVGRYLFSNGALFDLENPRQPRQIAKGSLAGQSFNGLGDKYIVTTNHWEGLQVYEISSDVQAYTALGQLDGVFNQLFISGQRGIAVYNTTQDWRQTKMRLLDLSNPQNPQLGAVFGEKEERPMAFKNSMAITAKAGLLRLYDMSQATPRMIGSLQIPDLYGLEVHDDLGVAYTYRYDYRTGVVQNLILLDLSQPHDPRKIGEIPTGYQPKTVRIGNILWLGAQEGLYALDISDPARAQFIGQQPSAATFGYLKRRGRRLLRVLAESDEATYVDLASEILRRTKVHPETFAIDFNTQWLAADILVGAGLNWEQTRHGRGSIKRRAKFWRRQRLERASQAWDKRLDVVRELAAAETSAWQTRVAMRRILVANDETLPALATTHLEAILWGDWPFAAVEAAREAELRANELSLRGVAALLWNVNPRRRRAILENMEAANTPFSAVIGTHLATLLGRDATSQIDVSRGSLSRSQSLQTGLTRRGREIALLLAARYNLSDPKFDASGAVAALPSLLSSNEAPLRNLGLDLCRRLAPELTLEVATLLPCLTPGVREAFIQALCMSVAKGRFSDAADLAVRVRHANAEVRSAVWRLIAASKTSPKITRDVWTGILRGLNLQYSYTTRVYTWKQSSYLETALNIPAALEVLARSGVKTDEIMRFGPRFWAQPIAPAAVFAAYALFTPAPDIVKAIASVPDAVWAEWKGAWLRVVSLNPKVLGDFWKAVQTEFTQATLLTEHLERLRARTFQDATVAATFAGAAGTLPPELLLQLIGAVDESVWSFWRPSLLAALQNDSATRAAFWNAARIIGLDNALLRARLVEDVEFAATFGLLEEDALDFDDPALESLLLNWLQVRVDTLNNDELARAGVHPLPDVRDWGLEILNQRGMNVPLALRLLESGLRDSIQAAKAWFEQVNAQRMAENSEPALELALALCDSPNLETRAYGREFLAGHLDYFMAMGLMTRLHENPNAEMQSYVAELLLKREAVKTDATPDATEFDRAVLRGRYRARKAKNLVQKRRAQSELLGDERTLLELARGHTPRDADWALTQLAKRALETPIEGVELAGTGGI